MNAAQIIALIWLALLTTVLWQTIKVVAILARDSLRRDETENEGAKRMLRWGLEQRRRALSREEEEAEA